MIVNPTHAGMTYPRHPWPLMFITSHMVSDQMALQRRSDWQHAWAQAAAELRGVVSTLGDVSWQQAGRATMMELAAAWEQRAKEAI